MQIYRSALLRFTPEGQPLYDEDGLLAVARTPDGRAYVFPLDGFSQTCLLEGVDQLGYLLARVPEIERHESEHAR